MLIVIFMTWLKLTFLKAWQIAIVAVVCALFSGLSWPYAITQSRNEISEWLGNQKLMLDTSVILTLGVIWQMAYCMLSAKLLYDGKVKKRTVWVYRMLRFFPGILILPVLFYLQIQVMYLLSGIDFATMTGSTHDRRSVVSRFVNDAQCMVMLMTVKTGGVGINLTVADTVFIFEPWWNRAAEEQAINRLHRIGQKKNVMSYSMIMRDTIEEKIRLLQEKKAELFDGLIGSDTTSSKQLSEEDIEFILG